MKYLIYLALLVIATSASAQNTQVFIGGEFGQSKSEWDDHTGEWEATFGLRAGVETDESRIYLSYNYSEIEDLIFDDTTYESHALVMNFDAKTKKHYGFLRVFAGINIGAIYSEWDLNNPLTEDQDDINLLYGAQAGLIIDVVDNIYIETGFKYSLTDAKKDEINPANIMNYYGALNFKF